MRRLEGQLLISRGHESRAAAEMIYSSDLLIFRHLLEEVLDRHRFG